MEAALKNQRIRDSFLATRTKRQGQVCRVYKVKVQENKLTETQREGILGIDMGCSTHFTLSTGKKISASVPETERLKLLQRKLARQKKGSKDRWKTVNLIRKEYQKISKKRQTCLISWCMSFYNGKLWPSKMRIYLDGRPAAMARACKIASWAE